MVAILDFYFQVINSKIETQNGVGITVISNRSLFYRRWGRF